MHRPAHQIIARSLPFISVVSIVVVVSTALVLFFSPMESEPSEEVDPFVGGLTRNYWSSVASAGTVDDADLDIFNARGGIVQMNRNADNRAGLNLRFAVTPTDNLTGSNTQEFIAARFRDNGEDARILVKLRSYNVVTGSASTLIVLDSDDVAPSNRFQLQTVFGDVAFDFQSNVYYLDVVLRKLGPDGKPGLTALVVGKTP